MADHTGIHQILMNLCTNAAHAMKEKGGDLEVSLEEVISVEGKTLKSGTYLKLSVTDTGSGIESENIEHIFEPYFTTKKSREGTGMGLAVVQGIVKNYGGEIKVCSKTGKGTTFEVFFPKVDGIASSNSQKDFRLLHGKECILFVDDERDMVYAAQTMLEKLGYTVIPSTSSLKALDIFSANPEQFDLIITDQIMSGMTGIDLVREIFKIRPEIPVILITGFSDEITSEVAKIEGIKEFILKPFNIEILSGIIRKLLDNS